LNAKKPLKNGFSGTGFKGLVVKTRFVKMEKLIRECSREIKDMAGRDVRVLYEDDAVRIGHEAGLSIYQIYLDCLKNGIYPYRYIRNRQIISQKEQLTLAESRVAVVGVGGLGGQVILLLGRVGIGHLLVVDRDAFDETNLNRQALSSKDSLGKPKVQSAVRALEKINPAVNVTGYEIILDESNARAILAGSHVLVDALDNVADRLVLEKTAKDLKIPMVHGALAGFQGQVMTIFPEDEGLSRIYGNGATSPDPRERPEAVLGVPALTASFIANLEAMEVIKILLNRGRLFRNMMLFVDLEDGELNQFAF
jgi:molybdopterin/thiamine biosynthesis adenylyltransferase